MRWSPSKKLKGSYACAVAAPLLSAADAAHPAAFAVAGRTHVRVPGTPGGAELIPSEQLLVPLLPGFTCSLSNLLLLASWFTVCDLTPSKHSCIEKQFWEMGRSYKEMHLHGGVGWCAGNAVAHGTGTDRARFFPNSLITTSCTCL